MMNRRKKNIVELTRMTASQALARPHMPLALVLDNVRSLSNVGAMLRTADAFSLREVVMCGITGTPPAAEITKTALGAEHSVHWRHEPDCAEALLAMRRQGWKICVLEQALGSVPLQEFHVEEGEKYVVVAGNEVEGVSQRVVDLADHVLEIPQRGAKHCLNVSVSAGIALWHFFSRMITF